jgi:hypothetical protein
VRPLRLPTLESAALVGWPALPPGPRTLMPVLPAATRRNVGLRLHISGSIRPRADRTFPPVRLRFGGLAWAEGVGFEPTRTLARPSGFQDRRHRPLGEPSRVRVIRDRGRIALSGPPLARKSSNWASVNSPASPSFSYLVVVERCPAHHGRPLARQGVTCDVSSGTTGEPL